MQTQKQEELSKMYALRAGLSVISQKCDIVDKNEEDLEKHEYLSHLYEKDFSDFDYLKNLAKEKGIKIRDKDGNLTREFHTFYQIIDEKLKNGHISEEYRNYKTNKEKIQELQNKIQNNQDYIENNQDRIEIAQNLKAHLNIDDRLKTVKGYKLLLAISLLVLITAVIIWAINMSIGNTVNGGAILLSFCGLIIFASIALVILFSIKLSNVKSELNERKKQLLKYESEITGYENNIAELRNKIKSETSELEKEEAYLESEHKRLSEELVATKNSYKTTEIILNKECQSIADTLQANYGDMIDKRDWENLDLIIYNYETGRADSIKEALQLVDTERRNNALIDSIKQASHEISTTIKSSIQELGSVLIQGFSSLSSQLEAQRIQMNMQHNEVINSMNAIGADISKYSKEMISQQSLNNALLAKANVSSKAMVDQMKKLNTKVK